LSREQFFYLKLVHHIQFDYLSLVCIILMDHLLIYYHDHSIKLQIWQTKGRKHHSLKKFQLNIVLIIESHRNRSIEEAQSWRLTGITQNNTQMNWTANIDKANMEDMSKGLPSYQGSIAALRFLPQKLTVLHYRIGEGMENELIVTASTGWPDRTKNAKYVQSTHLTEKN